MSLIVISNAQETGNIKFFWVKKTQLVQPNGFFFNVLRIENKTNTPIPIQLELQLPADGKTLTQIPKELTIEANSEKSVPIRYSPSRLCKVDSAYTVIATVALDGNQVQAPTKFKIEGVHKIQMDFDDNTLTFRPGEDEAVLKLQVKNDGNYVEQLNFEMDLSDGLALFDRSRKSFARQLAPGTVIEEEITIRHKGNMQDMSSSEEQITIDMISATSRTSKKISVIKLDNVYDNFGSHTGQTDNRVEYYLSHRQGFGFSSNILAGGSVNVSQGTLEYGLQLHDVSEKSLKQFLESNFLELAYHSDVISYGLGSSSFQGLSGLFKRNSLFIDKAFRLNDKNRFRLFANEALNEFNLGLAAGHEFITKKLVSTNSVGMNTNNELGTKSILFENLSNIYLGPFSALYRGNYTNVSDKNAIFDESTYMHTLKLDTRLPNEKLNFELDHRYLDSDRNSYALKSSYLYSTLRYLLNENGTQAMLRYNNSSVMQDMPIFKLKTSSDVIRTQAIIPLKNRLKLTSGFQLGQFKKEISDTHYFSEKNASLFSDLRYSFSKFAGRTSLQYGMKSLNDAIGAKSFWGANTEFEYQPLYNSNLFMELNYSDGASQIYYSERQKEIEAQLGLKQALPGNRNYLTLSAYYRDSPISPQSPINMKAGINFWTPGNINVNVNVTMKSNSQTSKMAVSNVEARVIKQFNWKNEENKFHNLEMIFFKDDNGNNIADKNEERLSGIKVMLIPLASKAKSPVLTSLVTSDNGIIRYKNLTAGSYRMKYFPIIDLNGYFNFEENETTIELFSNQTLEKGFSKAGKIYGSIVLNRSQFSSFGGLDVSNIRITATNSLGRTYSTLTDRFGNYTIYIPQNQEYTLSINNVFGDKFELKQNNVVIDLRDNNKYEFNFEVNEKKRKINFSK